MAGVVLVIYEVGFAIEATAAVMHIWISLQLDAG